MSGMIRSIAALSIVTLAFLAVLVVFDIVSLDMMERYAVKIALTACVLALACAALALLFRNRKP